MWAIGFRAASWFGVSHLAGRAFSGHDRKIRIFPTGVRHSRAGEAPMSSNPKGWAIASRRIAHEAEARTGSLDLGMLGLTELPGELFALTHLRELNLGEIEPDDSDQDEDEDDAELDSYLDKNEVDAIEEIYTPSLPNKLRSSLERLTSLSQLQVLSLVQMDIVDLAWTSRLVGLQSLYCSRTKISDLTPLSGLRALQSFSCHATQVSDLGPLKGLPALRLLYCGMTNVSDLRALKSLPCVRKLYCFNTQVSDLAPLTGLSTLQLLNCSETKVSDLAPLERLTALQELYCSDTQVSKLANGLTAL
jgi:internalin A